MSISVFDTKEQAEMGNETARALVRDSLADLLSNRPEVIVGEGLARRASSLAPMWASLSPAILLALFLVIIGRGAYAAPPIGIVPDPNVSRWFDSLQVPSGPKQGWGCCNVSDCRVVLYRTRGSGYEVFVKHGEELDWSAFPDGDDQWHAVPEAHILHRHDNPTGEAVACYWQGEVLCFVPPSMT